jgi:hypothetical protein
MSQHKYKNFYNVNKTQVTSEQKREEIDQMLTNETTMNKAEPWNKLGKTTKLKIITEYIDNTISSLHNLNQTEKDDLAQYLNLCIDKKKLQHVKDVQYNKVSGKLVTIPHLLFNATTRKFTLKRIEKEKRTTVKVVTTATKKTTGTGTGTGGKKAAKVATETNDIDIEMKE